MPVMRQIAAASTGNLKEGTTFTSPSQDFHSRKKSGAFSGGAVCILEASKLMEREKEIGKEIVVNHCQQTCSNELKTFACHADESLRPLQLVLARWHHVRSGDNEKCFFCDGGLRDWERGADPWKEHARWFPRCNFVKAVKGEEFTLRMNYANTVQVWIRPQYIYSYHLTSVYSTLGANQLTLHNGINWIGITTKRRDNVDFRHRFTSRPLDLFME